MLATFPPATPVASTSVQAAQLSAQRQAEQDQCDAKDGDTFGTQEERNQPQRVTFKKCLVNVPTFETKYREFSPLKRVMESVFVEAWDLYNKQVTNNLITQRLPKYSTEKLATEDTDDV